MLFSELGLSEPVLKAVEKCGYEHPTPIQEQAIPIILEGRDLIGASQTGTGKTAAFALPLLTRIQPIGKPQILVLEPTRELADQVAESFAEYGKFTGLKVALLYGGVGYGKQTEDLKKGGAHRCGHSRPAGGPLLPLHHALRRSQGPGSG